MSPYLDHVIVWRPICTYAHGGLVLWIVVRATETTGGNVEGVPRLSEYRP